MYAISLLLLHKLTAIPILLVASLMVSSIASYIFAVVIQQASAASRHHNHFPPITRSNNNFFSMSPSINVCCAWDNKFAAGQLTYIIIGGHPSSKRAVVESLNE